MKIIYTIFLPLIISCTQQTIGKNEFIFLKLEQDFNKSNLYIENPNSKISLFSESLYKCLKLDPNKYLHLNNTYNIKYNNEVISRVDEYKVKDSKIIEMVNNLTHTIYTTKRLNFSSLCWEDTFTKPIYSKNIEDKLFIFSSNENYVYFNNNSIEDILQKNPQKYKLDDIIIIINSYKIK